MIKRCAIAKPGFELLLTVLGDDDAIERYFAYAEATLGRPYAADFVLPLGRAAFEVAPAPGERRRHRGRWFRGGTSSSNIRRA